jgi:hypothetical protein
LTNLLGASVPLTSQLDPVAETLVVFWNPACGFCRAMHGDLRAWDERFEDGAAALVLVSAGKIAAVREEGFHSPVLLDPKFEAASQFQADGTPIGVLVGSDATIRSGLATGSGQIFALAARRRLTSLNG